MKFKNTLEYRIQIMACKIEVESEYVYLNLNMDLGGAD